jgi:nicotinamidase/pyrazinamidase
MTKKVLFVIDMQVDFLEPDGSLTIPGNNNWLISNVVNLIDKWEGDVICTADNHHDEDCEFEIFPEHCIAGTGGELLVERVSNTLKNIDGEYEIVGKESFAMHPSHIKEFVEEYADYDEWHFCGVCTSICVHDNIVALAERYKMMYDANMSIYIHKDCCHDFDYPAQEAALKRLQLLYGAKILHNIEPTIVENNNGKV